MSFSQVGIAERCQFSLGDYIDDRWKVDSFLGEGTFGQVLSAGAVYAAESAANAVAVGCCARCGRFAVHGLSVVVDYHWSGLRDLVDCHLRSGRRAGEECFGQLIVVFDCIVDALVAVVLAAQSIHEHTYKNKEDGCAYHAYYIYHSENIQGSATYTLGVCGCLNLDIYGACHRRVVCADKSVALGVYYNCRAVVDAGLLHGSANRLLYRLFKLLFVPRGGFGSGHGLGQVAACDDCYCQKCDKYSDKFFHKRFCLICREM